jgi:hypothetical protein
VRWFGGDAMEVAVCKFVQVLVVVSCMMLLPSRSLYIHLPDVSLYPAVQSIITLLYIILCLLYIACLLYIGYMPAVH